MVVTEIVTIDLKSGHNITTDGSAANELLQYILKTVTDQPGSLGAFHGVQTEDADRLDMFFDWKDINDHKAFIETGDSLYNPFVKRALELGTINLVHVDFAPIPFAEVATKAPLTETAIIYLPADVDTVAVVQACTSVGTACTENFQGCHGFAQGWVVEEVEHESLNGKGRGYCLAIGWDSVAAHLQYRETAVFQDTVQDVRKLVKASVAHHTTLVYTPPSAR